MTQQVGDALGRHIGTLRKCKACDREYEVRAMRYAYVCPDCMERFIAPDYTPTPQLPLTSQNIGERLNEIDGQLARYGSRIDPSIRMTIAMANWEYYKTPPWGEPTRPDPVYWIAAQYLEEHPNPKLLVLLGDVGRGKTYVAALIAKELALKGDLIQFIRWQRLTQRWKTSDNWGEFARHQIDPIMRIDFLVIDELARETEMTANERSTLETLLDERYERRMPTILCSNLALEGERFERYAGKMIWSRIEGWAGKDGVKVLGGPDRRKGIEVVK